MKKFNYCALGIVAIAVAMAFIFGAAPATADAVPLYSVAFDGFRSVGDLSWLAIGVGMTTLARDTYRDYELGDENDVPAVASDIIYEGSLVGDNGSGYGRPLVAADLALGFAREKCDNSSGSAGDKNIKVRVRGRVVLTVSSVAITDKGKAVYASDDNAFTLTETGNSYVGRIVRYVATDTCVVAFDFTRGGLAGNQLAPLTLNPGAPQSGTFNGTITGTDGGTELGSAYNAVATRINRLEKMLND